jgi:AraC-like DNA-binding protein
LDPIADLFETMHVTGFVQARLEVTAPWGFRKGADAGNGSHETPARNAGAAFHFAHFGLVSRGNCWLSIEGMPNALPLAGGDCFLLAPGSSYILRDSPRTRPRSFFEIAERLKSPVIQYGGGGAPTTIVSGWFRFDPVSVRALTRLLPPLIVVKAEQAESRALRTTMNLLGSELTEPAPGSALIVNRLADVLFIHCLRAHVASQPGACRKGWLRAVFDPQIGAALQAMHEKVAYPWTVGSLAAAAGMSRSAFAQRFKEMAEETPLEYLTNWRMQKATALLRKRDRKLFDVAKSVGYDSEAAFSKAFKRIFGRAPSEYQRMDAPASAAGATSRPVAKRA